MLLVDLQDLWVYVLLFVIVNCVCFCRILCVLFIYDAVVCV